jgi:HEPN domain
MKNPTDIREVADLRLFEADNLIALNLYDGAFYLTGYAVELYLKAKICENLELPDFYSQYAPKSDLSKIFLVHNLERLMLLSGLYAKFVLEKNANATFLRDWETLQLWSEKNRYDTKGTHSESDTTDFIESVKRMILWIKKQ